MYDDRTQIKIGSTESEQFTYDIIVPPGRNAVTTIK